MMTRIPHYNLDNMRRTSRTWLYLLTILMLLPGCVSHPDPTPVPVPEITSSPLPSPTLTPEPSPTPQGGEPVKGNLRKRINRLEENMPRADSNGYVIPDANNLVAFSEVIQAMEAGDLTSASEIAAAYRYRIFQYIDRGDHNAMDLLLEEKSPIQRGWGLFVFRMEHANNLIVEAPHPVSDQNTPRVALDLYRALDARALLVAGAHRDANNDGSADVSHSPGSIFLIVHNALVNNAQSAPGAVVVFQVHGFDSSKHPRYPDIVIGYNRNAPEPMIAQVIAIKDALTAIGLSVGLCDGKSWEDLCGTKDILASVPNGFAIHLELNEAVRADDTVFIQALTQAFDSTIP